MDDLRTIVDGLARIEDKLDQFLAKHAPRAAAAPVGDIAPASASDLDGQYGDPEIKYDPKQWKGPSYVGKRLSQTTPEYCDAVYGLALWKLRKDTEAGDEKKAGYARRDAARALGWKLRLESGWKPPVVGDDDIPF